MKEEGGEIEMQIARLDPNLQSFHDSTICLRWRMINGCLAKRMLRSWLRSLIAIIKSCCNGRVDPTAPPWLRCIVLGERLPSSADYQ